MQTGHLTVTIMGPSGHHTPCTTHQAIHIGDNIYLLNPCITYADGEVSPYVELYSNGEVWDADMYAPLSSAVSRRDKEDERTWSQIK